MSAQWEDSTIGETATVIAGQSPDGSCYNDAGRGTPFYQGKKEFGEKFIGPPTTWTTQIKRIAHAGDVLMSVRAPVGPVNFATQECCIGRGLAAIRNGPRLNRDFLFYFLLHKQDEIAGTEGAVFACINKDQIESIALPLPPLPEQRRIVAILDEAFAAIATAKANTEQNLTNARAVFESDLASIFTDRGLHWTMRRLADVSEVFGRGKSRHRPRNEPSLYGGKYPFVQTGDVRNAVDVIESYSQTYSEKGLAQSKLWPKGTVCITIAANIAESAILGFDSCFPDSMIGAVPNRRETSSEFLLFLLQSYKAHLKAQGKGSAQHNINMGTFEAQAFPFPPLKEQASVVARLMRLREETGTLADLAQRKLAALDALKASLLHHAFTGKLTTKSVRASLEHPNA